MAIYKTFDVSLDLKRPVSSRDVEVVEGDNGNRLRVTLTDEGSPVDLSGCLVLAVFAKTSGTVQQDTNGNGVTISGENHNIIEIELYTSSFAPGVVGCELQIYSADNSVLVTTAKFNFKCRRSIVNEDTIQSTEEFPLLLELITQVEDLYKQLDGAQEAETERVAAEQIRKANETARVTAENERAAKDAAKVYQGNYSASVTYLAGNTLTYNGSTYLCLKDSKGNAPTNTTYFALVSKAGRGIKSIVQTTTSTEPGGINVITITYDDNTTATFNVRNGSEAKALTAGDGLVITDYIISLDLDNYDGGAF